MEQQNNIQELQSVFDEIRHRSDDGREYWNSRELSDALGYSGYWKFKTVIDKAIAVANEKGMKIDEHFNQSVEMVRVGGGAFRKVETFHLSRLACLIIAENADGKKPMVQQARLFFSNTVSTGELIRNSVDSNILFYKTAQGETRIEVIFNGDTFWMSQRHIVTTEDIHSIMGGIDAQKLQSSMTLFESAAGDDYGCKAFGEITKPQWRFF